MSDLNSVVTSKKADGSWQSVHVPSGKVSHGLTAEESENEMRSILGMKNSGEFTEPLTSVRFEGIAKDVACFLEGEVSTMLALHSGFARLESLEDKVAYIKLGGGCSGCPSSALTLMSGVRDQLVEKFEGDVDDVAPVS